MLKLLANLFFVIFIGTMVSCSEDPEIKVSENEIRLAISKSDDYSQYTSSFVSASASLIGNGSCNLRELQEQGGWYKSVINHKEQPVYFIYCGGLHSSNRVYLNAVTGEIFR